jgi:hypothetical protein
MLPAVSVTAAATAIGAAIASKAIDNVSGGLLICILHCQQ